MQRFANRIADGAEYIIGVPFFIAVSAVTAFVMAIGLVGITAYERLTRS